MFAVALWVVALYPAMLLHEWSCETHERWKLQRQNAISADAFTAVDPVIALRLQGKRITYIAADLGLPKEAVRQIIIAHAELYLAERTTP